MLKTEMQHVREELVRIEDLNVPLNPVRVHGGTNINNIRFTLDYQICGPVVLVFGEALFDQDKTFTDGQPFSFNFITDKNYHSNLYFHHGYNSQINEHIGIRLNPTEGNIYIGFVNISQAKTIPSGNYKFSFVLPNV